MAEAFLVQRIAGSSGKDIGQAEVQLDFTTVTYNKSSHEPKVQSVTYNGAELVALQDYVVYSAAYTDAGTYNIVVSGIGDYSGAKEIPWTIEQAQGSISVEPSSVSISGALGSTTTAKLTITGDGEVTFGASDYVSLSREGTTLTVTSVAEGSGTVDIVLEDGRNYKGDRCALNVSVSEVSLVFENNSWETIAAVCAAGKASETWSVGDKKAFDIGGTTYHMQIIDFNHDDLDSSDSKYGTDYNGGTNKAAMTLMMEEVYSQTYRVDETNKNSCSWSDSEMRIQTVPQLKSQMQTELTSVLRKVAKKTAQSGANSTLLSTADDLFLASETEVSGNSNNSAAGEGTYYEFFKSGGSRVKKQDGTAKWWWLRSPCSDNNYAFLRVGSDGTLYDFSANLTIGGVVLCCCI